MWTRTPGGGTKDRILFCLFFVRSFFPFRSDEHLVHDSLFALGATVPFFFWRPRAGPRGRSRSRGWFGLTPGSAGSQLTWGDRVFGGDSSQVGEQLVRVQQIQSTQSAFAAILEDGFVVTGVFSRSKPWVTAAWVGCSGSRPGCTGFWLGRGWRGNRYIVFMHLISVNLGPLSGRFSVTHRLPPPSRCLFGWQSRA